MQAESELGWNTLDELAATTVQRTDGFAAFGGQLSQCSCERFVHSVTGPKGLPSTPCHARLQKEDARQATYHAKPRQFWHTPYPTGYGRSRASEGVAKTHFRAERRYHGNLGNAKLLLHKRWQNRLNQGESSLKRLLQNLSSAPFCPPGNPHDNVGAKG